MPLEWKVASCRIQPSQPPRFLGPLNTELGWHVSIMFQTARFGAPGQRIWMKLASGYKLISGRKGCWQILPPRGGLPPLNGWRHTQFCSVQTASNGRNTRKMVSWRYVMLFFFKRNLTSNSTRDIASFLWSFSNRARLLVCSFFWCNVFEFYCVT